MTDLMSPGAYLRKRREAAGVALELLASQLAGLPWRIRAPESSDVARLVEKLEDAEADRDNLTVPQAALLLNVFTLDVEVYELLLLHFHARRAPHLVRGLGVPRICAGCGCSDRDGCRTDRGVCAWAPRSNLSDPEICTACERAARLAAELAGVPDAFALRDDVLVLSSSKPFAAERELGRPIHAGAGPAEALQRSLQP